MPRLKRAHVDPGQGSGQTITSQVTPGAELFALCQTATPDGSLSRQELKLLQAWLDEQPASSVPAWDYVRGLIEQAVAIRKVAPPVLQALYRALEPTLPELVKRRRADLRLVSQEWPVPVEIEETEHLQNEVLASATFIVAGCQSAAKARVVERHARQSEPVILVRDRRDPHSPNAIHVCAANGKPFGFVPEHKARELAPLLERGARYRAHLVTLLRGRYTHVLIIQAYLYPPNATLGIQAAGVRKLAKRRSRTAGRLLRIAVGLLIAAAVAIVLW